jgi:hypothetical protein
MDTITEALALMKRKVELESTLSQSGAVYVTEERELLALRYRLEKYPEAIQAVAQAAHALRRPIAELNASDVESWANPAYAD